MIFCLVQCNACRALANAVSLHVDNQQAVALVRGVFPALVALAATDEAPGQVLLLVFRLLPLPLFPLLFFFLSPPLSLSPSLSPSSLPHLSL